MVGLLSAASGVLGSAGSSSPVDTGSAISGTTTDQNQRTGSFNVGSDGLPSWAIAIGVGLAVVLIARRL